MNLRKNFSSRQKAEIYARDRALCCFSGTSLWLLDFGAAPSSIDWADHITSCASGGSADVENGACASWVYNYIKRQHKDAVYLYAKGRPTADFFFLHEIVPANVADHLKRFARLEWPDWYFNRAIFHVLLAAGQRGQRRADGKRFSRGADYWSSAALNSLLAWRNAAGTVSSMKSRGLIPPRLGPDQKLLVTLAAAQTKSEIKKIIALVAPYVRASERIVARLAIVDNAIEAKALAAEANRDPYVVRRTREAVNVNVRRLF